MSWPIVLNWYIIIGASLIFIVLVTTLAYFFVANYNLERDIEVLKRSLVKLKTYVALRDKGLWATTSNTKEYPAIRTHRAPPRSSTPVSKPGYRRNEGEYT